MAYKREYNLPFERVPTPNKTKFLLLGNKGKCILDTQLAIPTVGVLGYVTVGNPWYSKVLGIILSHCPAPGLPLGVDICLFSMHVL